MNPEFLKFLEKKGYTETSYKELEVSKMAELDVEFQNLKFKELSDKLDGAVKEDDFNKVKTIVDNLQKLNISKALESLEELHGEITKLNENRGGNIQEGKMTKFFKEKCEEFKENNKYHSASITVKAPELMTTANIVPVVAEGWSPLFTNYVDNEVGEVPKPNNFVMQLVDVRTQPGTEAIYYSDRVNEEGDAEFIGEGTLKPLADAEWKTSKKNIKEVALRWKFTKRLMNHAPSVEADFREHANELIEQKMDDVALTGNETTDANQFDGIATLADPFIVPVQLANYYPAANIYDAINSVATYVRLNNFRGALTCVLNTVWKAKMQGIKDSQNRYIVPPFVTPDGNTVGEVRVQFENKMPADKILVGDMMKYKLVIAEDVVYDEGYENDDFSKNLVSRKLEAFLGSYKKDSDAGSIIYDDISTVLTAIETV